MWTTVHVLSALFTSFNVQWTTCIFTLHLCTPIICNSKVYITYSWKGALKQKSHTAHVRVLQKKGRKKREKQQQLGWAAYGIPSISNCIEEKPALILLLLSWNAQVFVASLAVPVMSALILLLLSLNAQAFVASLAVPVLSVKH